MDLLSNLKAMHELHAFSLKAAEEKFRQAETVKVALIAVDKAKDERTFEKLKKQGEKAIYHLDEAVTLDELKVDAWLEQVRITKEILKKERNRFNEKKAELEFNLKKIQALNEQIKKFNETPAGKKKPQRLLPEQDVGLELKPMAQALDEADFHTGSHEKEIELAQRQHTRDREQVTRFGKQLKEKEFKAPAKKR